MKISDLILIILICGLISVVVYGIHLMKTEGTQCIVSPITFGLDKLSKSYGDISCICNQGFSFNRTTISRVITWSGGLNG